MYTFLMLFILVTLTENRNIFNSARVKAKLLDYYINSK